MAATAWSISGFMSVIEAASGMPCCMAWALAITSSGIRWGITRAPTPAISTPQINTCTMATEATPRILPIIRSNGRTDETITSSTRLFFSSITDCMTIAP